MRNLSRLCGLLKLLKIEYDVMSKIHMRHGSPSGTDQLTPRRVTPTRGTGDLCNGQGSLALA